MALSGAAGLDVLVLQGCLDQPDRAEPALVAGLHGLLHFCRETFAQHVHLLMFSCARALTRHERPLKSPDRSRAARTRPLTRGPLGSDLQEIMTMLQDKDSAGGWSEPRATAVLVLQDGTVLEGFGIGAVGEATGEVCFNTAMTGYQEILTDPSYAGQIITFTFPHIGNVGTNEEDIETVNMARSSGIRGVVLAAAVTEPSNWRATRNLDAWLKARGIVGLTGVDTRALTALIRERGMPNAVIAHDPSGRFDLKALKARAAGLPAMTGLDLVPLVSGAQRFEWDETPWELGRGFGHRTGAKHRVVAIDYGVKRN